jgi:hypothetical protein
MTFVKIGDFVAPATVSGQVADRTWGDRASKAITLEMDHADAAALFVDGLEWSIIYQPEPYVDQSGATVTPEPEVYDNSEYCLAGSITDNRDGTVTVKMGKITAEEALAELREVLGE